MTDTKRVSLSLPAEVVDHLDYISSRLGISRSGFVSQLLEQADLASIRTILSHIPAQPTEGDMKRYRGDSKAYFEAQMARLAQFQGGLFDDTTE